MKRITLATLMVVLVTAATFAQKGQNPKGLYHLQRFIYENGRQTVPNFSQYKYAADSVGLLIMFQPSRLATRWSNLQVEIRESFPLLNTGEKPQGDDGHGIQIYNVDDNQFYFKWYNDRWANMSKLNEFITEVYTKEGIEKEVKQAFNMLENHIDTKASKFYGWWVRVGATAAPDGTGQQRQVPTIWKAYSPELSMVVTPVNNGKVLGCNTTNTIKYENDTTIWEIGHRCDIHWLSDDCHALTFVQENGQPLTEIWVRAGLPTKWQEVFNTHLETYRNGVDCIIQAVQTATNGDVQKAEGFIGEAVEKFVNIEVLTEGTMGIAMHLLVNKQQYKDCVDFSNRQLQLINDYVDKGHDHTSISRFNTYLIELYKAIATYRSGDKEKGKQMIEERQSVVDAEIERFKSLNSSSAMGRYTNLLYYHNLMLYSLGYDIMGTERTLLYLDALTLMAPAMTSQNKPMLLNCRGNCYLLDGDKENAQKLWQQIKDINTDYFKKQPDDNPLKKAFGE